MDAQMLISANVLQASRVCVWKTLRPGTGYESECCLHACQDVKTPKDVSTPQSNVGDDASRGHTFTAASVAANRLLRAINGPGEVLVKYT